MSGRGLAIPQEYKDTSRPYVVVQFENSEFVSREPIESAFEPAAKGAAKYTPSAPPTPVGGGILSMGSISRAFDIAARSRTAGFGKKLSLPGDRSGATTPKGEEKKEWLSGMTQAKPSASEPVWKHEVTLYVLFSLFGRPAGWDADSFAFSVRQRSYQRPLASLSDGVRSCAGGRGVPWYAGDQASHEERAGGRLVVPVRLSFLAFSFSV